MIVSSEPKFVFIEIGKCATTSMESSLLKFDDGGYSCKRKHYSAKMIPSYAKDYFRFTFVRNPYDRMVSMYNQFKKPNNLKIKKRKYLYEKSNQKSFSDFIIDISDGDFEVFEPMSLLEKTTIEGRVSMDFIGRFERLQEDFDKLCKMIEIPEMTLPHKNKSIQDSRNRDVYTDKARDIVSKAFANDLKYFSYDW